MDHQFSLDIYEKPVAQLSMGHEVIGRWLSEEMAHSTNEVTKLLDIILQLEQAQIFSRLIIGKEYELRFNQREVEVAALGADTDFDGELPEETHLYDQESYAECGLQDFKQLLEAWLIFIRPC